MLQLLKAPSSSQVTQFPVNIDVSTYCIDSKETKLNFKALMHFLLLFKKGAARGTESGVAVLAAHLRQIGRRRRPAGARERAQGARPTGVETGPQSGAAAQGADGRLVHVAMRPALAGGRRGGAQSPRLFLQRRETGRRRRLLPR